MANAGTCQQIARRILERALEGVDEARGADAIAKLVQAATNAARLLGQVSGEIRSDPLVIFLQQVGIRDEAHARRLVEIEKSCEGVTIEQAFDPALEIITLALREHPEWAVRVREKLPDAHDA